MQPHPAATQWEAEQRYADAIQWAVPFRVGAEPEHATHLTRVLYTVAVSAWRRAVRRPLHTQGRLLTTDEHGSQ